MAETTSWNYLPCKMPKSGLPVLVVKGNSAKTFVREAVYTGAGYWRGYGNAPILAWRPLPHTPVSLALKSVLDERYVLLDCIPRTSAQKKRLIKLEGKIRTADQARESEYERFVREACELLQARRNTETGKYYITQKWADISYLLSVDYFPAGKYNHKIAFAKKSEWKKVSSLLLIGFSAYECITFRVEAASAQRLHGK